jgi:hypothetical protein
LKKPPPTNSVTPNQIDKFRELARELECDDDEAAFDERLKRLAQKRPEPEKPPSK